MSLSFEEQRRIEQEEWTRARARESHAAFRQRERQEVDEKADKRRRYVATHGRDGAFRLTLIKWTAFATFGAVTVFASSVAEDGMLKALGDSLLGFGVWTGVGAIRAYYIVNSVR